MTLKATGGSCWWLFTSRAWVRAKMVWASCGLDGGPIKVTRFALYSWGPIWSKHTNGVVLFYFTITANKLFYYQDHEPIYMAEGKDCLKLWIGWMAHQEVWFVYDMDGVAKASIGMIQYEILVHPIGWLQGIAGNVSLWWIGILILGLGWKTVKPMLTGVSALSCSI